MLFIDNLSQFPLTKAYSSRYVQVKKVKVNSSAFMSYSVYIVIMKSKLTTLLAFINKNILFFIFNQAITLFISIFCAYAVFTSDWWKFSI